MFNGESPRLGFGSDQHQQKVPEEQFLDFDGPCAEEKEVSTIQEEESLVTENVSEEAESLANEARFQVDSL